jgi:HPt (histidine-containing phosphotransfer) domain-containing protein
MLKMYEDTTFNESMNKLNKALTDENYHEIHAVIHNLKGTLSYICANSFSAKCDEIQQIIKLKYMK